MSRASRVAKVWARSEAAWQKNLSEVYEAQKRVEEALNAREALIAMTDVPYDTDRVYIHRVQGPIPAGTDASETTQGRVFYLTVAADYWDELAVLDRPVYSDEVPVGEQIVRVVDETTGLVWDLWTVRAYGPSKVYGRVSQVAVKDVPDKNDERRQALLDIEEAKAEVEKAFRFYQEDPANLNEVEAVERALVQCKLAATRFETAQEGI
jgi:tetratricopeptide (TPR) repeat protein